MTLEEKLRQAEEAYHSLMTGSMVASITKDGREVSYTRADADKLQKYIMELKAQINGGHTNRRPPAGFYL